VEDIIKALKLDSVIELISDKEEKILKLRYGIDDGIAMSAKDVGKEFNMTTEEIKKIEAEALLKLKNAIGNE
jgi:RNA polymerase primary sigma factor